MTALPASHAAIPRAQRYMMRWQALAYHNQMAEWTLYALLLSGLPLISIFSSDWAWQRWTLVAHVLLGVFGFSAFVIPFWLSHRRLLRTTSRPLLRITGQILEYLLFATAASGYYLIVWGNRGGLIDGLIHDVHLFSSLGLTLVLIHHAWKWSVLHWFRRHPGHARQA